MIKKLLNWMKQLLNLVCLVILNYRLVRNYRDCNACLVRLEYSMLHTYLEWMTELPWKLPEELPVDLNNARQILESDHFGLERVKQRIIEFLAVQKLKPQGRAPILCFVGPPGVGKTSLGQSIARTLQRSFVRVSLGGIHDEAGMRGHRRTYIGAMPGNIVQSIVKLVLGIVS